MPRLCARIAMTGLLLLGVPGTVSGQGFERQEDLQGIELTSSLSAVSSDPSKRIDLFYRGPNNHLWTSLWPDQSGQWWSAPVDLLGDDLTSSPSAVRRGPRIDVFYRGPNNHLWTRWWPDESGAAWSAPVDLFGVDLTSSPSAISRDGETLDVFYRGPNGHLWKSSWPDASGVWWGAPEDLSFVELAGAPVAVSRSPLSIDVFLPGAAGGVTVMSWLKEVEHGIPAPQPLVPVPPPFHQVTGWQLAMPLSGVFVSGELTAWATSDRHLHTESVTVFYRGLNGHLWTIRWGIVVTQFGGWTQPVDLGFDISGNIAAVFRGGEPSALLSHVSKYVDEYRTTPYLFSRGSNNHIIQHSRDVFVNRQ
jgi:hypothetical protein